jgi:hypothetical protein
VASAISMSTSPLRTQSYMVMRNVDGIVQHGKTYTLTSVRRAQSALKALDGSCAVPTCGKEARGVPWLLRYQQEVWQRA